MGSIKGQTISGSYYKSRNDQKGTVKISIAVNSTGSAYKVTFDFVRESGFTYLSCNGYGVPGSPTHYGPDEDGHHLPLVVNIPSTVSTTSAWNNS